MNRNHRKRAHSDDQDDPESSSNFDHEDNSDDEGEYPERSSKRVDATGPITPGIPLSYPSLKCVLEWLDPNRRFDVSLCIPSVRAAERMVPLRIEELKLEENSMTINDVSYSVGIYRELKRSDEGPGKPHAPKSPEPIPLEERIPIDEPMLPTSVKRENAGRGAPYDVDKYGFLDVSFDKKLTPGDLSLLERPRARMTRRKAEADMHVVGREVAGGIYKCMPNSQSFYIHRRALDDSRYLFNRFLKNLPAPFENFLQLTIEEEGEEKKVWRGPYNLKAYEAFKILTTKIFHHDTIEVDRLSIMNDQMVLRLPANLKFHVGSFHIEENPGRVLPLLKPILADSSFPLDSVEVTAMDETDIALIKNWFTKLVIVHSWRHYLVDLPKITHFVGTYFDSVDLLRHWLEFHKEIGTCVTVGHRTQNEANAMFDRVKMKKNGFDFVIKKRQLLTIHVNHHSMIRTTVEKYPAPRHEQNWVLKMEVVPIGLN